MPRDRRVSSSALSSVRHEAARVSFSTYCILFIAFIETVAQFEQFVNYYDSHDNC